MKKLASVLIPLLTLLIPVFAEDLVIAKNGKTDYQIVTSAQTPKDEWNAKFLAWFLKEKTGAEFPVRTAYTMNKKKPSIILGNSKALRNIVGEFPYKGMKDQDHTVRSEGKNILLYGKGYDADFYAISEFLERCLGFRFYQRFVVPEIKKTPNLILKPFDYKLSWALRYRFLPQPQFSDYVRGETECRNRNRLVLSRYRKISDKNIFSFKNWPVEIQPKQANISRSHTAWLYLPTEGAPSKGYPFIENRDYFKTNPEFYAMNKAGKRGKKYPCFATKAMRREFTKNIEKHFEALGSDNVQIGVTYPDGVDVCHCPKCKELAEKYGAPGGAYFEFLMELGEEFLKTHPRATIHAIMYQERQTQIPPKLEPGKKFPPNIKFTYCDIVSKTNKTWDDPENKKAYEWLKKAMNLTNNIRVMTYYAHYGQIAFMPFASDNIVVDNIRKMAELGVEGNFFEFYPFNSGYNTDFMNFADLNLYLYYRFCKNPKLDYDKEVTEFMEHVYGPAAKLAKEYHDELVRLSTTENKYGIILSASNFNKELSYLTPDNIYKWELMFDEMTKLAKDSPAQIRKNVANLRRAVDMAAYGRWPELQKKHAEYFKDPDAVRKRIGEPKHKTFGKAAREYLTRSELAISFMGKEKPLPEQFKRIPPERIKRLVPRNKANCHEMSKVPKIVRDPDAAFGYGASIDRPDLPFHFGYYISDSKTHGPQVTLEKKDIDSSNGKYKLYHLGEVQPTIGSCPVWFSSRSWCTNLDLSSIVDLTDVNATWDAWVSLKFPKNFGGKDNDLVLCDQIVLVKKDAQSQTSPKAEEKE